MNLIVAVDENWGIGAKNDLLYSLKQDMAFFRETTLDRCFQNIIIPIVYQKLFIQVTFT